MFLDGQIKRVTICNVGLGWYLGGNKKISKINISYYHHPWVNHSNFISFTHDVVENSAFNQRHNIIHNIAIEKKIDDVSDITSSNEDPHRPLCWLRQGSEALLLFLVQWMVEARHPFL